MGGYLNRVIQLDFPELAGTERPDDHPDGPGRAIIWLTIRNPKLMAGNELVGGNRGVRRNADGSEDITGEAASEAYGGFAKLIIAGNVLDPAVDSDDPPPLPMPPSAADVGRYPIEILNRIGGILAESNPR